MLLVVSKAYERKHNDEAVHDMNKGRSVQFEKEQFCPSSGKGCKARDETMKAFTDVIAQPGKQQHESVFMVFGEICTINGMVKEESGV